jgi:ATP-dependent Lhr-like helicase
MPQWLDQLCLTGRVGWGRLSAPQNSGRALAPLPSMPVSVFARDNLSLWRTLAARPLPSDFSPDTDMVLRTLTQSGAMFFTELVRSTRLLPSRVAQALGELAARGWATSDSFEGLRALLIPSEKRAPFADLGRKRRHKTITSVEFAGRWNLLNQWPPVEEGPPQARDEALQAFARVLLRRYGIVFRRLLERESLRVSWYDLGRVYRRWEARGEIRGGHFVNGASGEQFALPEAIGLLRAIRKAARTNELITISAADPLNLLGILDSEPRIPAITANRILLRDGVPIAALCGGEIRGLKECGQLSESAIENALNVGSLSPELRRYYA